MDLIKKNVISGLKWTTLGTIVVAVIALLKLSILTRFLEKSDFGLMALVTFVMGFMNLFNDMGLTSAILHKKDISQKEYASLYWINILFSLVLYLLLLLLSPLVASFYEEPELRILIPLLGLNLIISAIGRMYKTIEAKKLKFKVVSIIDIIASVISLIVAIGLAISGYGVYTLVYSILVQYILQNSLYFLYGLKMYGLKFHFKYEETRPFLKIGIYRVGGQLANYFNRDIDILIIGKFFSAEILGGYSLAKELVRRPASLFGPIINRVGAPTLAKYNNDNNLLKANFLKLVNIMASVSIPLYICLIFLAKLVVGVLYGEEFLKITILVQILSINMIFRFIGGTIGNLVTATGRTDIEFKWNMLNLIITPIVVYVASQYSIIAVAISISILSVLLYYPSWIFLVKRLINVSFVEYSSAFFIVSLKWFYKSLK